jgi:dimeric dUTPase (all-alpha-NTP-PPase superfamily)
MRKISKDTFQKIWNMQADLNRIVGRDTGNVLNTDTVLAVKWCDQYLDEMCHEVYEAKNEFYHKWWSKEVKECPAMQYVIKDKAKLQVELIDMLHFLVSALQCQASFEDVYSCYESSDHYVVLYQSKDVYDKLTEMSNNNCNEDIYLNCENLIILMNIFGFLQMSEQDILKIYEMKHEVNIKRQQNNYSVLTKTEQDNEEIEKKIREK